MSESDLQKEFKIRDLEKKNKILSSKNVCLSLKNQALVKQVEARKIAEVDKVIKELKKEYKNGLTKEEADIIKDKLSFAESTKQRLTKENKLKDKTINEKNKIIIEKDKIIEKKEAIISEQESEIKALKDKVIEMSKALELSEYDRKKYLSILNEDGTTASIPTSQTPINKKKVIPNTREKTDKKIGGQIGHKKHKLEKFDDDEINENQYYELNECPNCHSKDLTLLDEEITKDVLDYEVKVIKKRHHFKKYKCNNCNCIVKQNIPNNLKEDNQYGAKVQTLALTLTNIGNVPINKVRRIIYGLSVNEIDLSEGFISKLQKRAHNGLERFLDDLKFYVTKLDIIHWDDTVIFIVTKRSCMRFYGNEQVALYIAHEHKDLDGILDDKILTMIPSTTKVVHDHNTVNYNDEFCFTNVECCEHLKRDLEKVSVNIPKRTWASKLKKLLIDHIHKRNIQLKDGAANKFNDQEINDFIINFNEYVMLGISENNNDNQVYYSSNEKALLNRLIKYRDNYLYWLYDFDIPVTNNLAERGLRGIKSKMKVAGQFQNIKNAEYYAGIRSYIETCHKNNINEYDAMVRLIEGNPYTLKEILNTSQAKNSN